MRTASAAQHLRKSHWFEKFNWFVTSENYLVISGRDAQQNELVVKRYMRCDMCCMCLRCFALWSEKALARCAALPLLSDNVVS